MFESCPSPDKPGSFGVLGGAKFVLGVAGDIAAYKAADLCSMLVQAGVNVEVILTPRSLQFVQPLLCRGLTQRPVHTLASEHWSEGSAGHVTLTPDVEALVVAPTSANTLARLALGQADDLLGMVALASHAPLLLAPAIKHSIWHHPAVQVHVETLRSRGALVVGPNSSRPASRMNGDGRLAPVDRIVGAVRLLLGRSDSLGWTRIAVTAEPTHEPLDPVRFLGNRSSGQMGFAIAQQLIDCGSAVHLVSGSTARQPPIGAEVTRIEPAHEMASATHAAVEGANALVMTAAVADFRPESASAHKIKKRPDQQELELPLVRNPDIFASIDRPGLVKIGFAAETENLVGAAEEKLRSKGLAMIVANDAVSTMGSERSTATLIRPGRPARNVSNVSKVELALLSADEVVDLVHRPMGERPR
ncbi:MAG: Phosphopantothenoylcysteine decarboxylase / Phosphopantothenoylcysteine synthetase [uncultured Thermomicrobiales bacterium]|uniref:Coenzyme A biosynthesis bifunctional protein CoaBC n=1 Tax=uncultured Thermomicrobiales bacterium TaxID=1645740 RepID=A0A6J4V8P3_9BACT|nr:MAG: Phosphopantothenoylcysteine decarboxylase / Phosphopantothenoylcysteine synthetase [uncultured Thermomicrobiales bacterium]